MYELESESEEDTQFIANILSYYPRTKYTLIFFCESVDSWELYIFAVQYSVTQIHILKVIVCKQTITMQSVDNSTHAKDVYLKPKSYLAISLRPTYVYNASIAMSLTSTDPPVKWSIRKSKYIQTRVLPAGSVINQREFLLLSKRPVNPQSQHNK